MSLAVRKIGTQIEPEREIRDDSQHLHARKRGGKPRERTFDHPCGNIHRDVPFGGDKRKPTFALAAITGSEVDKLAAGADGLRDLGAVGAENRSLRTRRIILGQRADRAIEGTSEIVVEIFRRNARWRSTQSGNERAPLGGGVDLETTDDAIIFHSTVWRDRTSADRWNDISWLRPMPASPLDNSPIAGASSGPFGEMHCNRWGAANGPLVARPNVNDRIVNGLPQ